MPAKLRLPLVDNLIGMQGDARTRAQIVAVIVALLVARVAGAGSPDDLAVREAVIEGNKAWASSSKSLDPTPLKKWFRDQALTDFTADFAEGRRLGFYIVFDPPQITFDSVQVDAKNREAVVRTTEIWSAAGHRLESDQCFSRNGPKQSRVIYTLKQEEPEEWKIAATTSEPIGKRTGSLPCDSPGPSRKATWPAWLPRARPTMCQLMTLLVSRRSAIGILRMKVARNVVWILVSFLAALGLASTNPGDHLTRRSARFSIEAFERLSVGESAESAAAALGDPIGTTQAGQIGACPSCRVYLFMGEPPAWVWRYEEAWLLVDESGAIADKIRTREP